MILYFILFFLLLYLFRRLSPVKGLKYIDAGSFSHLLKQKTDHVKILDVRDQGDYYAHHVEGAINISLGRLPHVKKKELHVNDEIILIADSKYHSKKAARILQRSGFQNLTFLENGMSAYHQFKDSHQNYGGL